MMLIMEVIDTNVKESPSSSYGEDVNEEYIDIEDKVDGCPLRYYELESTHIDERGRETISVAKVDVMAEFAKKNRGRTWEEAIEALHTECKADPKCATPMECYLEAWWACEDSDKEFDTHLFSPGCPNCVKVWEMKGYDPNKDLEL